MMCFVRFLKYFIFLFLFGSIVFSAISVYVKWNENDEKIARLIEKEMNTIFLEKRIIEKNLSGLISDITYLKYTFENYEELFGGENYRQLEEDWIAFMESNKIYFKLRFLDTNGNEMIRINYTESEAYATEMSDLENKGDRRYFQDSIVLGNNQIFMSRLDANVENGKVELPIQPVIRISTTVFNAEDELQGVLVISYDAENLLNEFDDISSTGVGNVCLLNSSGYWLDNPDNQNKEWTFMYETQKNISFRNEFPEIWEEIGVSEEGDIITDHGLYVYSSISPSFESTIHNEVSIVSEEDNWKIVSFVSGSESNGIIFEDSFYEFALETLNDNRLILLIILILSASFAFFIVTIRESKEKMKQYSYDPLTKVYNRKAGFELLEKTYNKLSKRCGKLSICFVDINSLKDINDTLGHEIGDELIMSVIEVIKKYIRDSDFIIRIGGDEFLIIFTQADLAESEEIWQKICREFEVINQEVIIQYKISVSHGIEEFRFEPNEFIDKIVNSADEKMYKEKRFVHSKTVCR